MARPNCSRNDPKSRRSRVEIWRDGSTTTRVAVLSMRCAKPARPRQEPAAKAILVTAVCFRNRLLGILATRVFLLLRITAGAGALKCKTPSVVRVHITNGAFFTTQFLVPVLGGLAARLDAIRQTLVYMGDLSQRNKLERGILVASEFASGAILAAQAPGTQKAAHRLSKPFGGREPGDRSMNA